MEIGTGDPTKWASTAEYTPEQKLAWEQYRKARADWSKQGGPLPDDGHGSGPAAPHPPAPAPPGPPAELPSPPPSWSMVDSNAGLPPANPTGSSSAAEAPPAQPLALPTAPAQEIDQVTEKRWYLWPQARNPDTMNCILKEINAAMLLGVMTPIAFMNRQGKTKTLMSDPQANTITYCESGSVQHVKLVLVKVVREENYNDDGFFALRLAGTENQDHECVLQWKVEDGGGPNDEREVGIWITMEKGAQDACSAGLLAGLEEVTYIHNWEARHTGESRTTTCNANLMTCMQTSCDRHGKRRKIRCVSVRTPPV